MNQAVEAALLARIRSIPISQTLEFEILAHGEGTCAMRVPHRAKYDGIYESFHGGIMMTAADSAAAFAVLTLAGADAKMATTDMSIRFLAKCVSDIRVEARVVKFGRTLVPVAVDVFDANGVLVAIAQIAYMRLG